MDDGWKGDCIENHQELGSRTFLPKRLLKIQWITASSIFNFLSLLHSRESSKEDHHKWQIATQINPFLKCT